MSEYAYGRKTQKSIRRCQAALSSLGAIIEDYPQAASSKQAYNLIQLVHNSLVASMKAKQVADEQKQTDKSISGFLSQLVQGITPENRHDEI